MKEYKWPYSNPTKEQFLKKIALAEKYLQKYGAELIETVREHGSWGVDDNDERVIEIINRNIWKIRNQYIRIDRVSFPEKPFLIIEYADTKDGFWNAADPFPYDLSDEEFEREIRLFIGIGKSEN